MKRSTVAPVLAVAAVVAVGATLYLAFGRRTSAPADAPIPQLLDRLNASRSEQERDEALAALFARGGEVTAPLLARYPKEAADSQVRANAAALLFRLPKADALAALDKLFQLEPDPNTRSAIRAQRGMREKSDQP